MHPAFTFSLRTFFLLITLLAVGCVALKYAGLAWWIIFASVTLLLGMAMPVLALVARGELRVFAIGFCIFVIVYAVVLRTIGQNEFHAANRGRLPTSLLLQHGYRLIHTVNYRDPTTGQELQNYQLTPGMVPGLGAPTPYPFTSPDPEYFMFIGQLLWSLFFGALGGYFALLIHRGNRTVQPNAAT